MDLSLQSAVLGQTEPAANPAGGGSIDLDAFDREMADNGIVHFKGVLDQATVAALRTDCEKVIALRRAVQTRNDVAAGMEGMGHHILGEDTRLDDFIAELPLWDAIERYFDGKFILLNFGATLNASAASLYTLKPHRDVRAWSKGYRLSLNMLVMLDDFLPENGATLFMEGSHRSEQPPSTEVFRAKARQRLGKAGDILLFDSLLVHAAAPNKSGARRAALTACFGRPFMKPQMDWPRFLGAPWEGRLTPKARQLLGYDARVAASLDEFYQPPERWTFKPDQR